MPRGQSLTYASLQGGANGPTVLTPVDITDTQGAIVCGYFTNAWAGLAAGEFRVTDLDTGQILADVVTDSTIHALIVVLGDVEGAPFALAITAAGPVLLPPPFVTPQTPRPKRLRLETLFGLGVGVWAMIGCTTTPMYQGPSEVG